MHALVHSVFHTANTYSHILYSFISEMRYSKIFLHPFIVLLKECIIHKKCSCCFTQAKLQYLLDLEFFTFFSFNSAIFLWAFNLTRRQALVETFTMLFLLHFYHQDSHYLQLLGCCGGANCWHFFPDQPFITDIIVCKCAAQSFWNIISCASLHFRRYTHILV